MNIRFIVLAILVAILTWVISLYFFYWLPSNPLLSLVGSLAGATGGLAILLIAKKLGLSIGLWNVLLFAVIGSLLVLFAASLQTKGRRDITINCSLSTPTAYPDTAEAELDWKVYWKETNNLDFTIKFKETNPKKTPFRKKIFFDKKEVPSSSGKTKGDRAVKEGDFYYDIICSNGNTVDPMVKIPPRYLSQEGND